MTTADAPKAQPADVHIGRDGYLFLSGGRHDVFPLFRGDASPDKRSINVFIENQIARIEACRAAGVPYCMVVFPEKCVVLADHVEGEGDLRSLFERSYADRLASSPAAEAVHYPLEALRAIDQAHTFDRTDTHLSVAGMTVIARLLAEEMVPDHAEGLEAAIRNRTVEREGAGDLGVKFEPRRTEVRQALLRPEGLRMASNGIRGGNDGILVMVDSPAAASDATLLIFGDSFFRAMLPMLGLLWRRVVFCRTRFLHSEMMRAVQPDHVIGGVAERYLSRCVPDAERPHFLSYPLARGLPITPDPDFADLWGRFFKNEAFT